MAGDVHVVVGTNPEFERSGLSPKPKLGDVALIYPVLLRDWSLTKMTRISASLESTGSVWGGRQPKSKGVLNSVYVDNHIFSKNTQG